MHYITESEAREAGISYQPLQDEADRLDDLWESAVEALAAQLWRE